MARGCAGACSPVCLWAKHLKCFCPSFSVRETAVHRVLLDLASHVGAVCRFQGEQLKWPLGTGRAEEGRAPSETAAG